MLARLDTLLTRIVILVTAALLSTFLLAYFIVEFSISSQRLQPRTALHVATVALEELQAKDWPDSLSDKELERLQITDYSLSEYPYNEPFSCLRRQSVGDLPASSAQEWLSRSRMAIG